MAAVTLPRYYPILDTDALARRGLPLVATAEAMLEGGAKILQLRHKTHLTREYFQQAGDIARLCFAEGIPLVVNDRTDLAALLNAGLHLGQDDLLPVTARKLLGKGPVIGYSTHNEAQFREALTQPLQYVAVGPVFATGSKARPDPVVGVALLARVRTLTSLPIAAIGGISRATARSVWDAGADTLAVIGDALPNEGGRRAVRERTEEWVALSRP